MIGLFWKSRILIQEQSLLESIKLLLYCCMGSVRSVVTDYLISIIGRVLGSLLSYCVGSFSMDNSFKVF